MDVQVRGPDGGLVAAGGPWTNVFFGVSEPLRRTDPVAPWCRVVRPSALQRYDSVLRRMGTSVERAWLTPREQESLAEGPLPLARVVAAKQAALDWLGSLSVQASAGEVEILADDDGSPKLHLSTDELDETPALAVASSEGAAAAAVATHCEALGLAVGPTPTPIADLSDDERKILLPLAVMWGASWCRRLAATVRRAAVQLGAADAPDQVRLLSVEGRGRRIWADTPSGSVDVNVARTAADGGEALLAWCLVEEET